ncbi:MAG: HAD family hydrolase [Acidobacteria bacterium]|nr:HAD family hydrolase [Acidobacteriota bacterium]
MRSSRQDAGKRLPVLFDIDGTLLLSSRVGYRAMLEAAGHMVGRPVTLTGVDFAGRLDPEIWAGIAGLNEIENAASREAEFRASYTSILARMVREDDIVQLLPGVSDLVQRLRNDGAVTLGLLTGNYPETGLLKIRAAGLDPRDFPVAAWGCDGNSRRDLPRVAMRRYAEKFGRPIPPNRVLVIGDTPIDIDCARANGCVALGVATGPSYSLGDLQASLPDLAVSDLADTEYLVSWILSRGSCHGMEPAAE